MSPGYDARYLVPPRGPSVARLLDANVVLIVASYAAGASLCLNLT